ncbi:MAG TPA: sugar-transfer associated ATP-grasp domain-containing protein [bacterium]|nr:sugar-transfer associated ATP-grasp domain-containing protein [bacterium]
MNRIRFILGCLRQFNQDIRILGDGCYLYCWADLIWSWFRFGCSPNDYFRYEFNRKSNYEKNRFLTYARSKKVVKKYNNPDKINLVFDKRVSHRIFSEFISRNWLDTGSCSYDDFEKFVLKYREVIIKPAMGSQGKGIHKYSYGGQDGLEKKFSEIKGCLVEEVIRQHATMRSLNPSSVNTARIVTFLSGGEVNIIGCYMRAGITTSVVDNVSSGGMIAGVDTATGIVCTVGSTEKFEKYLEHPLSGTAIIGLKIPHWADVLDTVKKAGLLVPGIRYVGWDIAILDNGVEFIEANYESGHLVQMADQKGLYEPICKILSFERLNRIKT